MSATPVLLSLAVVRSRSDNCRESDAERCAFADGAFDSHSGLMLVDDFFAGGQTETGSTLAAAIRTILRGEEGFKDFGKILGRYSLSRITHGQDNRDRKSVV